MEYVVSRAGTALVTLHGGSETTARDDARSELEGAFELLAAEGELADWEISTATVHEHPTAPFEPYTIAVSFRVAVTVEAEEEPRATERGAEAIDDALASAGVESVSYAAEATASAA